MRRKKQSPNKGGRNHRTQTHKPRLAGQQEKQKQKKQSLIRGEGPPDKGSLRKPNEPPLRRRPSLRRHAPQSTTTRKDRDPRTCQGEPKTPWDQSEPNPFKSGKPGWGSAREGERGESTTLIARKQEKGAPRIETEAPPAPPPTQHQAPRTRTETENQDPPTHQVPEPTTDLAGTARPSETPGREEPHPRTLVVTDVANR